MAFYPTPHGSRLAFLLATSFTLGGCINVALTPITPAELSTEAKSDRQHAQLNIEPISGAISLEEAVARALKYNLEGRTRMMEEAIALHQYDLSRYDMLPGVVAAAGYYHRDKDHITNSEDSVTGAPSLANPSISSERTHTTTDLGLTWNVLDFGLSYYTARQNADRVLIAQERRRKSMHTLIQDVRSAFWRAASAQKLKDKVRQALYDAEQALADARNAENERLRSPLESLRYQRQLHENLRLLESINQELATAQFELAHLINAPMMQPLSVIEPAEGLDPAILEENIDALEETAITRNADLREQFYNARIARLETRKALARIFPSLSFNYTLKHDSDDFLINNSWNEAGTQISYNLINIFSMPTQKKLAEAGVELADQRRMAMQMAVLAQVHVARLQYDSTVRQFRRADAIADIDGKIAAHSTHQAQSQTQSQLEQVSNQTTSILSQIRRYQALAQAHAAASRLQATLGLEPEIGNVSETSLPALTEALAKTLTPHEKADTATPKENPTEQGQ